MKYLELLRFWLRDDPSVLSGNKCMHKVNQYEFIIWTNRIQQDHVRKPIVDMAMRRITSPKSKFIQEACVGIVIMFGSAGTSRLSEPCKSTRLQLHQPWKTHENTECPRAGRSQNRESDGEISCVMKSDPMFSRKRCRYETCKPARWQQRKPTKKHQTYKKAALGIFVGFKMGPTQQKSEPKLDKDPWVVYVRSSRLLPRIPLCRKIERSQLHVNRTNCEPN